MKEKLESEQLQTLIIPIKNFRWYEEGREIVFEGMMFDVRSVTKQGDNYVVTGLFDHMETTRTRKRKRPRCKDHFRITFPNTYKPGSNSYFICTGIRKELLMLERTL
jgi:hypothetical protein